MSGYFDKKNFSYAFYLHIHSIYGRSYGWDALQKHSVKTKVDCMLHGSQKHSAHTKAQRFEWLTKHSANTKAHIVCISKNRIILSIIKIVSFPWLNDTAIIYERCLLQSWSKPNAKSTLNFSSWPNSRQYCNSMETFDTKKLNDYNCWETFLDFGFSRSFTISEPKHKAKFSGGGGKFPVTPVTTTNLHAERVRRCFLL
jgi:hypothetical protein